MIEWKVKFAAAVADDLTLIEDYLAESYLAFGEPVIEARHHAAARIEAILTSADRLARAPERGAAHDDLFPGVRHLTMDRAIYWYRVESVTRTVLVLGIFFGGQDHQRHMLVRLLGAQP